MLSRGIRHKKISMVLPKRSHVRGVSRFDLEMQRVGTSGWFLPKAIWSRIQWNISNTLTLTF